MRFVQNTAIRHTDAVAYLNEVALHSLRHFVIGEFTREEVLKVNNLAPLLFNAISFFHVDVRKILSKNIASVIN